MEKILSQTPMNMVELAEEIKKIKKREGELNFRANKTEEYLNYFVNLKKEDAEELYKAIEKLKIPRIRDQHIHKLIDILPATETDVKNVLSAYPITINKENLKKIAAVIKKAVPETKK